MVLERVDDGTEGIGAQFLYLIEPFCQFQPCRINMALTVVNIRQFHGQFIGLPQFGIVFEDDVRPPLLTLCPFGLMFGENELCTCEQLLTRISIGVSEGSVLLSQLFGCSYLLILQVARHPAIRDTHVVQCIIVKFLHMESVIGNSCLGERGAGYEHHGGGQVEGYFFHPEPLVAA